MKAVKSAGRCYEGIFATGLLALVVFVLTLPLFPSGDGPVHIYYSKILYLLATHQAGIYGNVYFIRHLVQPYSLHYFWLILFEQFVSVAVAEKTFVAAILLVNALGFRFLARRLGASAPTVSLAILPFLLSWALSSGFFNFCFAAGVLSFAYGLYLCWLDEPRASWIALYVGALFVLVLSHPVPLLLLILLLIGENALLLWNPFRAHSAAQLSLRSPQTLALLFALIAFAFPMLIADKAAVADSLLRDLRPHVEQLKAIAGGYRLSAFFAGTPWAICLTAYLVALAPAGIWLLLRTGAPERIRNGVASPADRLCFTSLIILLATVIFPESMNGSALFADRMIPLLWPFLFVGAATVPMSLRLERWAAGLAILGTAASLLFGYLYLRPIAGQQAALDHASLPAGARGLFVEPAIPRRPFTNHLAAGELVWGGARSFAEHHDVLLNSPWMQLTIVPVGERGRSGLLRDSLAGSYSEDPAELGRLLATHSDKARAVLATADFLLYSDPNAETATVANAVRGFFPLNSQWHCTARDFYAVCVHPGTHPAL